MIVKQKNKYLVKDSEGKKTLGTHETKKEAQAQLRAIEASKAKRKALEKFAKGGIKKDKMPCNKPKRDTSGSKKTHVVKACQDGKEKIVRFGHKMPDGTSNPKRRKSYCARSKGIGKLKDKLSANYWSRKAWKC